MLAAPEGTPPPDQARADTAIAEPDDVHSLPTVADVAAPSNLEVPETEVTAPSANRPTPPPPLAVPANLVEDTATSRDAMSTSSEVTDTSPFSQGPEGTGGDSVDSEVLTKTVVEEGGAELAPPPPAGKLPPLPVPRTPVPAAPPTARAPGDPPRPNRSSTVPPQGVAAQSVAARPNKPTGAPPIPSDAKKDAASRSGVMSSAPPPGALPASGRPSDVLPRPPPSAVVRPGNPAGPQSPVPPMIPGQAPPAGAAMIPGQAPPAGAAMMQSYPTPSHMAGPPAPGAMQQNPGPPGMMASPAPPGMMASPAPPGVMASPAPPGMMSSPVPPGMMASPAPPGGAGMADMPAAYALPGAGVAMAPPPAAQAPGQVLVHTPVPPGIIGPPPDLNEGPDLGAALDGLEQEAGGPQHTPTGNAVWRTAHPSAQKWAAKRHGGAVRTPKPGIIAIGLMLAGFGAYLLAIFLPSKQPLTAAKIEEISRQAGVDENAWRFSEQLIDAANVNAALFVLLGIVIVLRGAMFRQQAGGQGRSAIGKPAVMLIACFFLLSVSFAALLISASA